MSGSDDLDPLDTWLRREIQPLAPPPGTFEGISKRARRRKVGKLAAASSAAAVVAAAAFAVPAITSPRLSPSGDSGGVAAGGAGTAAATGTAGRPTPGPTARTAPRLPAPASSAPSRGASATSLPPGFQPASATFVSSPDGWVLGHSTTGGADCGGGTCVSIVATTDAGHTWTTASAPPASIYSGGATGVSSLRYLDGTNGWAYGPDLWSTHNGGLTWTKVPTGGKVVVDLETSKGRAFAVFATCGAPGASPTAIAEYGQSCTGFTLESTPARADDWAPVGAATTGLSGTGTSPAQLTSPSIIFGGAAGWLLGPDGAVYSGPLSGGAWSLVSATPCPGPAARPMTPSVLYYEVTGGTLLDVCGVSPAGTAGTAAARPDIFYSASGGQSWQLQVSGPTARAIGSVAYSPAVPDIVAVRGGGLYIRPASTGQWRQVSGTPPGGFSFVGTTTYTQGVAVPATELNEIWMTYDGGQTWRPYKIGS